MQLFGSLKLLMALLDSSCPLFGRSGPKMDSKMVSKSSLEIDYKEVQILVKQWSKSELKTEQKERLCCFKKIAPTGFCPSVFEAFRLSKNAYFEEEVFKMAKKS